MKWPIVCGGHGRQKCGRELFNHHESVSQTFFFSRSRQIIFARKVPAAIITAAKVMRVRRLMNRNKAAFIWPIYWLPPVNWKIASRITHYSRVFFFPTSSRRSMYVHLLSHLKCGWQVTGSAACRKKGFQLALLAIARTWIYTRRRRRTLLLLLDALWSWIYCLVAKWKAINWCSLAINKSIYCREISCFLLMSFGEINTTRLSETM